MFDSGMTNHQHDGSWRTILRGAAGILVTSVVAGALVATALTPVVAITGVGLRNTAMAFESLPGDIALGEHAQRNRIYGIRDGQPAKIADVYDENREDLAWDEVSPYLKDAAVAGEDRRFYDHGGIDPQAVLRAGFGFVTESGDSGGSTISMQLVKNIRITESQQLESEEARKAAYEEAIRKTPGRKIQEMRLAISLEKRYTKNEILLAYLNLAAFGRATYGVQAASERYYSIPAKDLSAVQAASLIAIVQSPQALNLADPVNFPDNKVRRDFILDNMLDLKMISKAQHTEAIATLVEAYVKPQNPTNGCLYAASAKSFCDYVVRNIPYLSALGATEDEREANWKRGGFELYTSLDLGQQDVAQQQVSERAPADEGRFSLGAAAVAVQPGTGRILVMAQNKGYNNTPQATPAETALNFSTDLAFGGSNGFQTGSTYKIFTLVRWLQTGHSVRETVNGSPRSAPASSFKCDGAPLSGNPLTFTNDAPGEGGAQTVLSSTARSINGSFVSMAQKLDLCEIRAVAESMGVHRADGAPLETFPSSVLGINLISPLTMAEAIATIAANGTHCVPTAVDRIVDRDGNELPGQAPQCTPAIAPNVAATAAFALSSVFQGGGTAVSANTRDGVPIMGKTGTTDGSYQNWLVGATTKVAMAVWVGNIKGDPAKATARNIGGEQSLRRVTIAGTNGANVKFVVFRAMLQAMNANPAFRGEAFPAPDPKLVARVAPPAPPKPIAPPPPPPEDGDNDNDGNNGNGNGNNNDNDNDNND